MSHVALFLSKMGIPMIMEYGIFVLILQTVWYCPSLRFRSELGIPICFWHFCPLDHKYFLFLSLKDCYQVNFSDLYFSLNLLVLLLLLCSKLGILFFFTSFGQFVWFQCKVHIFWEGHNILRNLHLTFDRHYIGQK